MVVWPRNFSNICLAHSGIHRAADDSVNSMTATLAQMRSSSSSRATAVDQVIRLSHEPFNGESALVHRVL